MEGTIASIAHVSTGKCHLFCRLRLFERSDPALYFDRLFQRLFSTCGRRSCPHHCSNHHFAYRAVSYEIAGHYGRSWLQTWVHCNETSSPCALIFFPRCLGWREADGSARRIKSIMERIATYFMERCAILCHLLDGLWRVQKSHWTQPQVQHERIASVICSWCLVRHGMSNAECSLFEYH